MHRGDLKILCLAVCWFACARPAASQAYRFTNVVNGATERPDGLGVFYLIYGRTTPAFDGAWVVFRDQGPQNDDGSHAAIWSYNLQDSKLRKLVDFNTAVPGGSFGATFHNFLLTGSAPVLRNGTVIFAARDSANREGLYSVPAGGGAPKRIADRDTADPSGGNFTLFEPYQRLMGAFSFDGSTVAFNATGSTQVNGNYSARPDGANLGLVADGVVPAQNGKITGFQAPAISGSNVAMAGSDGVADGAGYNGLYLGTVGAGGAVTELLNSTQQLPGTANAAFHTRFDAPVLALDGTLMAFHASDSKSVSTANPAGYFGLFSSVLGSHTMQTVADVNSTLPGLGKLRAIASGGVAVNAGGILFQATDAAGASALFLAKDGAVTRLIGTGDTLDGQTVVRVADPGPSALSGGGFAFTADLGGRSPALYVAAPTGVTLNAVTDAASYATASISPGEIVAVFGSGLGPRTVANFALDANGRMPDTLAGAQIFVNDIASPLIYVSDMQSAAVVPFEITGTEARVVVRYGGAISAALTMPLTNTSPALFSADASGRGAGAISNADGSLNSAANPARPGTVAVLWASGLGQMVPPPPSGSVMPASPLPVLRYPPTVAIGGQKAEVIYAGPAPLSIAGLYQINFLVPAGLPAGAVEVTITADGRQSQHGLTLAVGQ